MEAVGHNPRSSSAAIARITRRGFSLIEAAIVLGVVGLVIGGIWVAAANVRNAWTANKIVEDVLVTVKNIQNALSANDIMNLPNGADLGPYLIKMSLVPPNWHSPASSRPINPYFTDAFVSVYKTMNLATYNSSNPTLVLNVPAGYKFCTPVARALVQTGAFTYVHVLSYAHSSWVDIYASSTVDYIASKCKNSGSYGVIRLTFSPVRINN